MRNNIGWSCVWIDISAPELDIHRISELLQVRATHYYTRDMCSPKLFEGARDVAPRGEECCWQYRMRASPRWMPCRGLEQLVNKFNNKRAVLSRISAKKNVSISLNMNMECTAQFSGPFVWATHDVVRFAGEVGASIVIGAEWYAREPRRGQR